MDKTLDNTNIEEDDLEEDQIYKENYPKDMKFMGNRNLWRVLNKMTSESCKYLNGVIVMDTGNGCVVKSVVQIKDQISQSLTFVPGVSIREDSHGNKYLG